MNQREASSEAAQPTPRGHPKSIRLIASKADETQCHVGAPQALAAACGPALGSTTLPAATLPGPSAAPRGTGDRGMSHPPLPIVWGQGKDGAHVSS